jgi:hypothetical protein
MSAAKWSGRSGGKRKEIRITATARLYARLLDMTIADEKNCRRLKETVRVREALADHFYFNNEYQSTDASWSNYFYCFNCAARVNR